MKKLQLPYTIRTPEADELPNRQDIFDAIQKRENANIVEGFTITEDRTNKYGYNFFAEINIDNDNLWTLFKSLAIEFQAKVKLICKHIDGEPMYGKYTDKLDLFKKLDPFAKELSQDGFLEFGIINDQKSVLEEVYINRAKYIQYWGINQNKFQSVMDKFKLINVTHLNFIDEYPMVTESLKYNNPFVFDTTDMLALLIEIA